MNKFVSPASDSDVSAEPPPLVEKKSRSSDNTSLPGDIRRVSSVSQAGNKQKVGFMKMFFKKQKDEEMF